MPSIQTLRRLTVWLLYAVPITALIVGESFLFPYILPRTVFFRLLIEVAVLVGIGILIQSKAQWSKQDYFLYAWGAYLLAVIAAALTSISPLLAWFSDIERMWGVFTLIHLVALYVLLRTFFMGEEWKRFLQLFVGVGSAVAIYGIFQYYGIIDNPNVGGRIFGTLGNAAYMAMYMVYTAAFAGFLLLTSSKQGERWCYAAAIVVSGSAFVFAGIRGTLLGVAVAATLTIALYAWLGRSKKVKIGSVAVLATAIAIIVAAQLFPQSGWVMGNPLLSRLTNLTLAGSTMETRLIGWNAAWQGFRERPIIGVGWENYLAVFNRYFDADYYLIAASEPYFDRAHNAWLDALVMSGAIGFIIFISFPIIIGWYLHRGLRREAMSLEETLLFMALAVAYYIHLFFVFDDLNSYIGFIVLCAFVEYRVRRAPAVELSGPITPTPVRYGLAGAGVIIVLVAGYLLNVKLAQAANVTIQGLSQQYMDKVVEKFETALGYEVIPSRNIILSYAGYLIRLGEQANEIQADPARRKVFTEGVTLAFEYLEKEVTKDPQNALIYNRIATLNNTALAVLGEAEYYNHALVAGQKSIELSREHLQYYHTLVDTYLLSGQEKEAVAAAQTAIDINPDYGPNYYHLARAQTAAGELDAALATAARLPQYGAYQVHPNLFTALAQKLRAAERRADAVQAVRYGLEIYPTNAELLVRLAYLQLEQEDTEAAIATFQRLGETNPTLSAEVTYAIEQIRAGNIEELLRQLER